MFKVPIKIKSRAETSRTYNNNGKPVSFKSHKKYNDSLVMFER